MTHASDTMLRVPYGDDDGFFPSYAPPPDAAMNTAAYGDDGLFPSYSSPPHLLEAGREDSGNSAFLPFSSSPPFALLTPSAPSTPSAAWEDAVAMLPANPFVSSSPPSWTSVEDGFDATPSPVSTAASLSPPLSVDASQQSAVASPAPLSQHTKRKPKCQSACVPCRTAKTACDGQRYSATQRWRSQAHCTLHLLTELLLLLPRCQTVCSLRDSTQS
jgi:hypothetical protein